MSAPFDEAWFARQQWWLLRLLNARLTWRLSRWLLCIRPGAAGYDRPIRQLLPHAYIVPGPSPAERIMDVRTHAKFAKRIYRLGWPVWWLLHFWDWAVADRFVPRWSFGFAVLIVFPDPAPGVTSCDGTVSRQGVDELWATIIAGAGNNASDVALTGNLGYTTTITVNQWTTVRRYIFLFDSSALFGGTVTAATLSLSGQNALDTLGVGAFAINIYASNPASNTSLVIADYSAVSSTPFSVDLPYASWLFPNLYNNFVLNVAGLAAVVTGISKFSARTVADATNTAPTWVAGGNMFTALTTTMADQAGTANDPMLTITYTPVANTGPLLGGFRNYLVQ